MLGRQCCRRPAEASCRAVGRIDVGTQPLSGDERTIITCVRSARQGVRARKRREDASHLRIAQQSQRFGSQAGELFISIYFNSI